MSNITDEWVQKNRDILHRYFFKVIINKSNRDSYKDINMSMSYKLRYNGYSVTIDFDDGKPDSGWYIIDKYNGNSYSLENFLSYLRDERLNVLMNEI